MVQNLSYLHLWIKIICTVVFTAGIKELRFKAAYNPYTEPSMEVFSYHKGQMPVVLGMWSGIFSITLYLYLPRGHENIICNPV